MTYIIEISINIKKNSNISEITNNIISIANEHRMNKFYKEFEFIGKNRQIYRNHCILIIEFEEHDELVSLFIKKIKKIKTTRIECIALDDVIYKLIYASRNYLNIMEKWTKLTLFVSSENQCLPKSVHFILNPPLQKTVRLMVITLK